MGAETCFVCGGYVYTSAEFLKELSNNNVEIYKDRPDMKLLGSCFGHQVICNAIFKVRIPSETFAPALLLPASN
jgi:hypothetical protein